MRANVLALSQENRRALSCHGQIHRTSTPSAEMNFLPGPRRRLLQAGAAIQA